MISHNIIYTASEIEHYYSNNRIKWSQFYPSEQNIFDSCGIKQGDSVLDIGCGCGGLGLALKERFFITDYTGIDISEQAVITGSIMNPDGFFVAGDILSISPDSLIKKQFDIVVSLSCVDWNIEFEKMLSVAWDYVKPGGLFISSFRLTDLFGVVLENVLSTSWQYINFNGIRQGEKAPYVVMNAKDLIEKLCAFYPKNITANGYWGKPSLTAVTPYQKLCFSAFSIKKRMEGDDSSIQFDITLPEEILASIAPLLE